MTSNCFLVLCGLPAAGKTDFVRNFQHYLIRLQTGSPTAGLKTTFGAFNADATCEYEPSREPYEESSCSSTQLASSLPYSLSFQIFHVCFDEIITSDLEAEVLRLTTGSGETVRMTLVVCQFFSNKARRTYNY